MSSNAQIPDNNATPFPDEVWNIIAGHYLQSRFNQSWGPEISEHPHSNLTNFNLGAAHPTIRNALLTALRVDSLFLEVRYFHCQHTQYVRPSWAPIATQVFLGDITHPELHHVFGYPQVHPVWQLKQAGHTVHSLLINFKCENLCPHAIPALMAFVPAETAQILTLMPILQRMRPRQGQGLRPSGVEVLSQADRNLPLIRSRIEHAVQLIQSIMPGVNIGIQTLASSQDNMRVHQEVRVARMIDREWHLIAPFLESYIDGLEDLINRGTPVHELAGCAESFLTNFQLPGFAGLPDATVNATDTTFLSMLNIFNRFLSIFFDGLAEYLLRRPATAALQRHYTLDAIDAHVNTNWQFLGMKMRKLASWAEAIVEEYTSTDNTYVPNEKNLSMFVQACNVVTSDNTLRFAMSRARRANPSLRRYQHISYISNMATAHSPQYSGILPPSRDIAKILDSLRSTHFEIDNVIQFHGLDTPGLRDAGLRVQELIMIVNMETTPIPATGLRPYELLDWTDRLLIPRDPVITHTGRYECIEPIEINEDTVDMMGEFRRRGIFTRNR